MAKKSLKKPEIPKTDAENWLTQIDNAKKVRKNWRQKFKVDLCYEYFEGNQRPPGVQEADWITINMIYSVLVSELPTLYSTDPYFYVNLKKSFSPNPMDIALFEAKAEMRQAMLNYLKTTLKLKMKARLCIFDAFFQYGVAKVHLYADLIQNPESGKPITDEDGNPIFGDGDKPVMHPEEIPANKEYKVSRIHPDDFLVDADAGPLDEDVNWKAHRIKRPLATVKEDKKYRQEARDSVQAVEMKTDDAEKMREDRKKGGTIYANELQAEPDIAILWEIYDIKNRQWLTVAEGCKEYLIEPAHIPPGIKTDPFVDLRFMLRDDSWYPFPPISPLTDPQREYCDARSKVMAHRKRFNRKYEFYGNAFDNPDEALARLQNGEDGTVIIKNQPMQAVFAIQDAPVDQQVHTELAYLRHDFEDLAIGANQRGSSQGVDSATEAGILERRTEIREGDKVGLTGDFMVSIAKKLDHLIEAHITEDQAVKVDGPGGEVWSLIKADAYTEINGEYDYSIDVGSTTPQLPEIERAQFNAILNLLISAPQLMSRPLLLKEIFKMYSMNSPLIVNELVQLAHDMLSGKIPMTGQQGSAPGAPQQNPASIMGGQAAGINNFRGGMQ
jgi:hypothetical protein